MLNSTKAISESVTNELSNRSKIKLSGPVDFALCVKLGNSYRHLSANIASAIEKIHINTLEKNILTPLL
jgi:hypothetical protein